MSCCPFERTAVVKLGHGCLYQIFDVEFSTVVISKHTFTLQMLQRTSSSITVATATHRSLLHVMTGSGDHAAPARAHRLSQTCAAIELAPHAAAPSLARRPSHPHAASPATRRAILASCCRARPTRHHHCLARPCVVAEPAPLFRSSDASRKDVVADLTQGCPSSPPR
jgi:hypothetical protein